MWSRASNAALLLNMTDGNGLQEWSAAADAACWLLLLITDLQQRSCMASFLTSLTRSSDSEQRSSAARLIERVAGRGASPMQTQDLLLPPLLLLAADADVSVRQVALSDPTASFTIPPVHSHTVITSEEERLEVVESAA